MTEKATIVSYENFISKSGIGIILKQAVPAVNFNQEVVWQRNMHLEMEARS
jgi:hypothetical protein